MTRLTDSESAAQIQEEMRRHRLRLTSGGYFMVTGTFKGEETKWRFGSAFDISRKCAERTKTKCEAMYPGENFEVEEVTEENYDLPRNLL